MESNYYISNQQDVMKIFQQYSQVLDRNISIILIGGAALLEYGLKDATKDIDIVCTCSDDRKALQESAKLLGFQFTEPDERHKRLRLKIIAINGGHTLDIYNQKISGDFGLTESMWERAKLKKIVGNITINYASKEDIFIMKLIAKRRGDIEDCSVLASSSRLDYDSIYKEIAQQYSAAPFAIELKLWITYIEEAIGELEERYDINIPIADKLSILANSYNSAWELGQDK